MEFELTEEQKAWQQEVRAFIRGNRSRGVQIPLMCFS